MDEATLPHATAWITVVQTRQGPSNQVDWTKMRGAEHYPLFTADQMREFRSNGVLEERKRVTTALQPIFWTCDMHDAWHRAIPNTQAAFKHLLNVLFTGDPNKDIREQ